MKAFFRKLRSKISGFPYYQKVLFGAIGAIVIFLMIIGLIKFGNILAFVLIYGWLAGEISEATGQNIWLVRALAVPLAIIIVWAFACCLSLSSKKRQLGVITLIAVALVSFFTIFLITQDQFFQRTTGKPTKYYAKTLDGYVVSDSPGYDTKYGIKLAIVTPEIAKDIHAAQGRVEVAKDRDVFFSPTTGEPVKWYCRLDNGNIEIFNQPGFHPKTGKPLEPVKVEVVVEYLKKEAEEQQRQQARLREERDRQRAIEETKVKPQESKKIQEAKEAFQLLLTFIVLGGGPLIILGILGWMEYEKKINNPFVALLALFVMGILWAIVVILLSIMGIIIPEGIDQVFNP